MTPVSREMRRALASMNPDNPNDPEFLTNIQQAQSMDRADQRSVPSYIERVRQRQAELADSVSAQIKAERAERNRGLGRQIDLMRTQREGKTREIDRQLRFRETTSTRAAEIATAREQTNKAWRRWVTGIIEHPDRHCSLDIPDALRVQWLGCHEALNKPDNLDAIVLDHDPDKLSVFFIERHHRTVSGFSNNDLSFFRSLNLPTRDKIDHLFADGKFGRQDRLLQYIELGRRTKTKKTGGRQRATLEVRDYASNTELPTVITEKLLAQLHRFKELGFDWIFLPLHIDLPGAHGINSGYYNIDEQTRQELGISTDPMFDHFKVLKLD